MLDLKALDQALQTHVRPGTFPVAIRMIAPGEALPERVRRPHKDFSVQVAICQGLAMARRYGWVIALGRDDISCPPAKAVWGFEPMLDYFTQGLCSVGMYTETRQAGARAESEVVKWDYRQWEAVLAAPLHRATFEPHLVLIYGNPAQVLRLTVAALWKRGGRIHSSFSGRVDCSDEVIVTMKTGECQVVLPCNGDRVFAMTQDDEMAFTIPAARIGEIIEGLEGTHKGGVRYPIPQFLRFTPQYPEQYIKLAELWKQSTAS